MVKKNLSSVLELTLTTKSLFLEPEWLELIEFPWHRLVGNTNNLLKYGALYKHTLIYCCLLQ